MAEADKAGVGRTAFYSGTRTLMELGLIEETSETRKGKRVKYNKLTEDGNAVAKLVIEIDKLLADRDSARKA
jgi:predicted transcriptional regulator with HTH domain